MGNSFAISVRKRSVKVMKTNGETMKLRVPLKAGDVTKDQPGHVILDSEAVRHFGIRAKPLEPQQDLSHKKIYFLVENIKLFPENDSRNIMSSRRVQSGISTSAKDRLECLMLSRRSASDLTSLARRPTNSFGGPSDGPVRVRMRLPKAQLAKLVQESNDEVEVVDKIIEIYMGNNKSRSGVDDVAERGGGILRRDEWSSGRLLVDHHHKAQSKKRVSFLPTNDGKIRLEEET